MLQPISDRVIVKVKKDEDENIGGIYVTSAAKKKPTEGTVVAVGPGAVTSDGKTLPMTVKKGDTVLYEKYSGTNIKYQGEEYLVLHEKDILAIAK